MAGPHLLVLALCLHAAAARPGPRTTAKPSSGGPGVVATPPPVVGAVPRQTLVSGMNMSKPVVDASALAELKGRLLQRVDRNTPAGQRGVEVLFDLAMNKLLHFDQVQGVAQWSVFFRLFWNDERLAFNGTEVFGQGWESLYDGISMATEPFWLPDIVATYSSGTSFEDHGCSVYDASFLEANGYNVMWSRPGVINVPCRISLDMFPFDTQHCALIVGPWSDQSYHFRALRDGNASNKFSGDLNSEEWEVVGAYTESKVQEYVNGIFEEVHYTLVFRRYPHYYVVNAVLPMALVVVLSLMTMWLPIEGGSGERLGFSVGLLLTIMATALFTAEFRPATSEDTWMDRYQASCLLLTFIPVFESVLVVWLQFIYEKVGNHECDDQEKRNSEDEYPRALERTPILRRSRTETSLERFAAGVQSKDLVSSTKTAMKANFRMRVIVFLVQKLPSFEWIITGGKGKDPVSPRTLDVWARHATAVLALVVAGQMVSQIPVKPHAASIKRLLIAVCAGGIFYLLSASLAALFLLFRISVLCSQASAAKARRLMHIAHHEERHKQLLVAERREEAVPDASDLESGSRTGCRVAAGPESWNEVQLDLSSPSSEPEVGVILHNSAAHLDLPPPSLGREEAEVVRETSEAEMDLPLRSVDRKAAVVLDTSEANDKEAKAMPDYDGNAPPSGDGLGRGQRLDRVEPQGYRRRYMEGGLLVPPPAQSERRQGEQPEKSDRSTSSGSERGFQALNAEHTSCQISRQTL